MAGGEFQELVEQVSADGTPDVVEQIAEGEEHERPLFPEEIIDGAGQQAEEDSDALEASPVPEVDNPESYKYYQSRYDKAQARIDQMEQHMQQQAAALQHLLSQQPSNGQPQVTPQQAMSGSPNGASGNLLQKPVPKPKPDDFDPVESVTDPSSASYQWREHRERYIDDMLAWNEQVEMVRVQRMRQAEEQRARQDSMQAYQTQLATSYGFTPDETQDFMTVMDKPDVLTLDNLVKFYRLLKGQPVQQQRQQAEKQRPRMPLPPVPPAGTGVPQQAEKKSDVESVMDYFKAQEKADNPFSNL